MAQYRADTRLILDLTRALRVAQAGQVVPAPEPVAEVLPWWGWLTGGALGGVVVGLVVGVVVSR